MHRKVTEALLSRRSSPTASGECAFVARPHRKVGVGEFEQLHALCHGMGDGVDQDW